MHAEFNLLITVVFVAIAAGICILLPKGQKWVALLASSLVVYSFLYGWHILWLLAMAATTYWGAWQIRKAQWWPMLLVSLLLLPLLIEKVSNPSPHYLTGNSLAMSAQGKLPVTIIIGLSYFTFNAISYLADVKRRYIDPESSFPRLLFYLLFFPALLSGPLHRYKFIRQQLAAIAITPGSLANGFMLMSWGFFKNMVVAQRLQFVLQGMETSGVYVLLQGLVFFLFLYVNFSSFIDIVQGIALLFNLTLKSNFHNRVYMACTRQQFWQGWHITLNEWFRDYFFFSVVKYDRQRRFTNLLLLLTFLLIALWHGFTLVLFVWGLLNGCWIIAEKKLMGKWQPENWWQRALGRIYHLSLASVLAALFITPSLPWLLQQLCSQSRLSFDKGNGFVLLVLAIAFAGMDWLNQKAGDQRMDLYLQSRPYWQRIGIVGGLLVAIFLFGLTNSIANYYMRF